MTSRRDFIKQSAASLALTAGTGFAATQSKRPEPDFFWTYLTHFGMNSWKDVPLETADSTRSENYLTRCAANYVRWEKPTWMEISQKLVDSGCNQIIIDLAEIVVYPSHPELAVNGSWSVEQLRAELERLRGMGFEVIPKLNFSACHDSWLKEYHRMVSTERYYQVCRDVIRDVVEIFDHPRLFHLGYDEEKPFYQREHLLSVCRQGELWWHDFLWFAKVVEKEGARPWIWSDYIWDHKDEYLRRMPKSVLQSNWYYGKSFAPVDADGVVVPRVAAFDWLDKAGFDQVPTGANWECKTNFPDMITYCDNHFDRSRIKGYMMANWQRPVARHQKKALESIDIMAAAIKDRS